MKELTLGFCPIGNGTAISPFDQIFSKKLDISKGDNIKHCDAVVFWGGTDIHSSLYGAEANSHSQATGKFPSHRDEFEWAAMKYCKIHKIPMIGVCRGAQMLCAMAGGWLIQHVTGHQCGHHSMITSDGKLLTTTSAHHQMMYPFEVNHEMLAYSTRDLSSTYQDGLNGEVEMESKVEPEVVWFPDIRGLAIQGHPEWDDPKGSFNAYILDLVREKALNLVDAPF